MGRLVLGRRTNSIMGRERLPACRRAGVVIDSTPRRPRRGQDRDARDEDKIATLATKTTLRRSRRGQHRNARNVFVVVVVTPHLHHNPCPPYPHPHPHPQPHHHLPSLFLSLHASLSRVLVVLLVFIVVVDNLENINTLQIQEIPE